MGWAYDNPFIFINFINDGKHKTERYSTPKKFLGFCETCGKRVWGEKMFNAIVQNMENARDKGDLCFEHEILEIQE